MKHINTLLVLFSFLVVSCHKSTIIDGLVQDAHSGTPIVGAAVYISIVRDKGHANSENTYLFAKTDKEGRFYFEDKEILAVYSAEIEADGYGHRLYEYPELKERECNKPIYKLIPRDGVLKVRLVNTSGTIDSLFFIALNECDYLYYHFSYGQKADPFPLSQGKDESHLAYFKTCRGKPTYLNWRFDRYDYASIQNDTLEIGMDDTTNYTFNY